MNHLLLKTTQATQIRQRGAALIVSLILLSVISILAITSSNRVSVEMKAVGSMKERSVAFQAAEAALSMVEKQLVAAPPPVHMLRSTCAGVGCFTPSCADGLCFGGSYLIADTQYDCSTHNENSVVEPVPVWEDPMLNIWDTASRHKKIDVKSVDASVKYIVEFMCFVGKDKFTPFDSEHKNDGVPLFRITTYAESDGGRASVALQSTFKILTNI